MTNEKMRVAFAEFTHGNFFNASVNIAEQYAAACVANETEFLRETIKIQAQALKDDLDVWQRQRDANAKLRDALQGCLDWIGNGEDMLAGCSDDVIRKLSADIKRFESILAETSGEK